MTTQSSGTAVLTRSTPAERHARQGATEARRMFADLATSGYEETVAASGALIDRIQSGPAPVAFKTAFAETMDILINRAFGL